jgi:hypothetical protein
MSKTIKWVFVLAALVFCGAAMAGVIQYEPGALGAMAFAAAGNTAPFDSNPRLTQIAMAVKPQGMIADLVCPRVPVDGEKFIYSKLESADLFNIPDTNIGRTSEPNQVDFGATDVPDKITDQGLDSFVPNRDQKVADAQQTNFKPFAVAAEGTAILVELAREKRVADLYSNPATYHASLRVALAGNDQWSDYANSDPYAAIMDALDGMLVRPNIFTMGRKVFTKLRSHPSIVAAVLNNQGDIAGGAAAKGSVTRKALADLLELDEVYVGEAFYNAAKKGQAANMARLWGNHAALLRIDRNVRSTEGFVLPTFAMTAQWMDRFVTTIPEPKRGALGGNTVRVVEFVKEIVTFQEGGYLFQNAVA